MYSMLSWKYESRLTGKQDDKPSRQHVGMSASSQQSMPTCLRVIMADCQPSFLLASQVVNKLAVWLASMMAEWQVMRMVCRHESKQAGKHASMLSNKLACWQASQSTCLQGGCLAG
jgi:hypothetical protein